MIGSDFLSWFGETSLAVSILIALVLSVRRQVALRFGAEAAYLLWLAPTLRLILPTLSILPASWRAAPATIDSAWTFAIDTAAGDAIVQTTPPFDGSAALFAIWAAGAAVFIAVQLGAQRRFIKALLTGSTGPSREIRAEAAMIAARNGVNALPPIRIASANVGPLVAGVFRPVIILPANFADHYSSGERQLAFAHEFSHIKRGDLATTLAALFFRAAQWPNPLAHFAFRAFRADQEAACDAAVIAGNRSYPDISYAYGAALVKSAAQKFEAPAASLAMSNHLKERLMLLKNRANASAAVGRALAAALIFAGVAASASYSYAAEKDAKKEMKTVKKESVSSINVIEADDGETTDIEDVKGAHKVEIRNENGVRTVKAWDKNGKLISERTMKGDDGDRKIRIVTKDGKEKTVIIGAAPGHPTWAVDLFGDDDGEAGERKMRKVIVVGKGDGEEMNFVGNCAPNLEAHALFLSDDDESDDGERRIMKQVICIDGAHDADPAKRAETLRKVIDRMEADSKREAEHRAKMIEKLKAELAAAENEAKKK
jgi:beta-lactamase regulating signal transducer with metallopeptidase domain